MAAIDKCIGLALLDFCRDYSAIQMYDSSGVGSMSMQVCMVDLNRSVVVPQRKLEVMLPEKGSMDVRRTKKTNRCPHR